MSGLTRSQLARLSRISPVCLRSIEHGYGNITVRTLSCVANAFGLSLAELGACAMPEDYLMDLVRKARMMAGIKKI